MDVDERADDAHQRSVTGDVSARENRMHEASSNEEEASTSNPIFAGTKRQCAQGTVTLHDPVSPCVPLAAESLN